MVCVENLAVMPRLVLFNKPFGVLSQFTDATGRPTLADFIKFPGCYPAGRLDRDSEGLLLLTDNGLLAHQLTHPHNKTRKIYWAQVEGSPTNADLMRLRLGVRLNDGPTLPARASIIDSPRIWPRDPPIRHRASIPTRWLQIEIHEGRNRQVRRMTAAIGFPTLRLIRSAIGPWQLRALRPGAWYKLNVPVPRNGKSPHRKTMR